MNNTQRNRFVGVLVLVAAIVLPTILLAQNDDHRVMLPLMMTAPIRQFEYEPIGDAKFLRTTDITSDHLNNIYVLEKAGLIYRLQLDGTKELFMDIQDRVCADGAEEGLLGIAFHPDYENNGYFYVSYTGTVKKCESSGSTRNDMRLMVGRFSVNQERTAGNSSSEVKFFESVVTNEVHNGGGLAFHPFDGKLYLSIGEDFALLIAQDSKSWRGKLIRMDVNNPYDEGVMHGVRDGKIHAPTEEVARGLRNPWRFAIDPANGDIYIGDVGRDKWEELNHLPWGATGNAANFGWPCLEGDYNPSNDNVDCDDPFRYTQPIVRFGHETPFHCSIVVGDVIDGGPRNGGSLIVTDWCAGIIYAVSDDGGWQTKQLGSVADGGHLLADLHRLDDSIWIGGAYGFDTPTQAVYIQLPDGR